MKLYKEHDEGSLEQLQAVRNVLLAARTCLKTGGWTQHWFATERGEHCLLGAIQIGSDAPSRITQIAHCVVRDALPKRWRGSKYTTPIAAYNDDPATTKQGVICVLGRAIRSVEAQIAAKEYIRETD